MSPKLTALFDSIGTNPDEIRALAAGRYPTPMRVVLPPDVHRPICVICGRPVGLKTCIARPIQPHDPLPTP